MRYVLVGLVILWAQAAFAQNVQPPSPIYDCSGTVGTSSALVSFPRGGTSGPAAPTSYLEITNPNTSTELGVNLTGAAAVLHAAGTGSLVGEGSTLWLDVAGVPNNQVSIVAASSSTPYTCWYR